MSPLKNPHVYASRSKADLQEANPSDPNFKAKAASKRLSKTHFADKFKKLAGKRSKKSAY